jgi:hypothetical protein
MSEDVGLEDVPMDSPEDGTSWLRDAVFYETYPQSFADSDGDGIGDLPGALVHLAHLAAVQQCGSRSVPHLSA